MKDSIFCLPEALRIFEDVKNSGTSRILVVGGIPICFVYLFLSMKRGARRQVIFGLPEKDRWLPESINNLCKAGHYDRGVLAFIPTARHKQHVITLLAMGKQTDDAEILELEKVVARGFSNLSPETTRVFGFGACLRLNSEIMYLLPLKSSPIDLGSFSELEKSYAEIIRQAPATMLRKIACKQGESISLQLLYGHVLSLIATTTPTSYDKQERTPKMIHRTQAPPAPITVSQIEVKLSSSLLLHSVPDMVPVDVMLDIIKRLLPRCA